MKESFAISRRLRWWLPLGIWTLLAAVSLTPGWRLIESWGYDWLNVLLPSTVPDARIVIVGIDEPSFAEFERRWPWPRELHASLIDRLHSAGAAVIAFDVLFADPSESSADRALAEAIGRARRVVLGADEVVVEDKHSIRWMRIEPLHLFTDAGAKAGFISVTLDGDGAVRMRPSGEQRFWRQILDVWGVAPASVKNDVPRTTSYIRFAGPSHTYSYVSYYQAADPDEFLPRDFFKNRIVLVGRDLKTSPTPEERRADMFETPFTALTGTLMPGVEIHANIVDNMLNDRAVSGAPVALLLVMIVAIAALTTWITYPWAPVRSGLRSAAVALALLLGSALAFEYANLWIPVLVLVAGCVTTYAAQGALAFVEEGRRRRYLRNAFAHYVAPEIVDEIVDHPERLHLGGERRDVTIMFTDLAGFTPIAERLEAEQITNLLNRYFSSMVNVIMKHHGTVTRFIGDAIMAMWGAPIDDPEQARRACAAAREMQRSLSEFRGTLRAQALPELHMRIGIHSGSAVVGNLGSLERFDYTATGDTVNLAARLEGVNKLYGTEILLSKSTAGKVGGSAGLRHIDSVRVKGKTEAVEIFTLNDDVEVNRLTDRAIDAYRKREWALAEERWQEIRTRAPGDSVAALYLERLAILIQSPPGDDWTGVTTLDTK